MTCLKEFCTINLPLRITPKAEVIKVKKKKKLTNVQLFAQLLRSSLPPDSALQNIEFDKDLNCVIIEVDNQKLAQELIKFSQNKKIN